MSCWNGRKCTEISTVRRASRSKRRSLEGSRDILFDIDWQGTEQLSGRTSGGADLVPVFVLPPTFRELRSRLDRRAEDAA